MAEPIFALEHISFTYPGGRQVFRDMDFALYPDRQIGLYGPNGRGQTTFFRLIMGLAAPQEGRILFHGRPLATEKDFRELRCKVGLVLQHAEDPLFCPTVLEDVAFGPVSYPHLQSSMPVYSSPRPRRSARSATPPALTASCRIRRGLGMKPSSRRGIS